MERIDLIAVRDTLDAVMVELEQLVKDKEWYVTTIVEQIIDAKQRVNEALGETLYNWEEELTPSQIFRTEELDFED